MSFNKKIFCLLFFCLPLLAMSASRFVKIGTTRMDTASAGNWDVRAVNGDISYLKFKVNGKVIRSVNLSKLAEAGWAAFFESKVISAKKVNDKYYVLFSYRHSSRPPGNEARKECGAGFEYAVAMICLDTKLKITHFESYLTDSCNNNIENKVYDYDVKHPEHGIWLHKDEQPGK